MTRSFSSISLYSYSAIFFIRCQSSMYSSKKSLEVACWFKDSPLPISRLGLSFSSRVRKWALFERLKMRWLGYWVLLSCLTRFVSIVFIFRSKLTSLISSSFELRSVRYVALKKVRFSASSASKKAIVGSECCLVRCSGNGWSYFALSLDLCRRLFKMLLVSIKETCLATRAFFWKMGWFICVVARYSSLMSSREM